MARPHPDPDREILLDFVDRLRPLLEEVVREIDSPINENRDATSAREAWTELLPHFEKLRNWLEKSPTARLKLEGVGLTGKQLRFKMVGFDRAHRAYQTSPGKRSLRRRVLEWANRILGSLGVAPGAEAIREFKDALEGLLGEG